MSTLNHTLQSSFIWQYNISVWVQRCVWLSKSTTCEQECTDSLPHCTSPRPPPKKKKLFQKLLMGCIKKCRPTMHKQKCFCVQVSSNWWASVKPKTLWIISLKFYWLRSIHQKYLYHFWFSFSVLIKWREQYINILKLLKLMNWAQKKG